MQNSEKNPGVIPWTPILGNRKGGENLLLKMYQNSPTAMQDSKKFPVIPPDHSFRGEERERIEGKFVFVLQKCTKTFL